MPWNFGLLGAVSSSAPPPPQTITVFESFIQSGLYTWNKPAGIVSLSFLIAGAQGGRSGAGGGRIDGEFTNIPETLYLRVGGRGVPGALAAGGFNGGGQAGGSSGSEGSGGGASDIRIGTSLESRILVAGGGGGRGAGLGSGGGGGGLTPLNGRTGQGQGGFAGSQVAGGNGGASNGGGTPSTAGTLGVGGNGGIGPLYGGGGGGGGYYGGGGGGADEDSCCTDAGGGGGGSSFADPNYVTNVVHATGQQPGDGRIELTYTILVG